MPRYIDADRADKTLHDLLNMVKQEKETAKNERERKRKSDIAAGVVCCLMELRDAPTADVQEVKHGHWIDGYCGDYVCSVCGGAFSSELPYMARKYDAETEEIMRYCMHCGAKMDGGDEDAVDR